MAGRGSTAGSEAKEVLRAVPGAASPRWEQLIAPYKSVARAGMVLEDFGETPDAREDLCEGTKTASMKKAVSTGRRLNSCGDQGTYRYPNLAQYASRVQDEYSDTLYSYRN